MPALVSQFQGCILGHALGDALGVPFEGVPADAIYRDFGGAAKYLREMPIDELIYSDDTQMMISVLEELIENARIDYRSLMRRFAAHYEPHRGYGQGARRIIEAAAAGEDWEQLVASHQRGGSYGNGAAMRASPLGLYFHHDQRKLDHETTQSAIPTHTHELGIDGAVVFATAVALSVRSAGTPFDRNSFFCSLSASAVTDEFKYQLARAQTLTPTDPIPFGSSLPAHRSVASAICCFAESPDDYLGSVRSAIALGDDTDTLAGMAGALAGARLGIDAVPGHLLERLEAGPEGRHYLFELAQRLYSRFAISMPA